MMRMVLLKFGALAIQHRGLCTWLIPVPQVQCHQSWILESCIEQICEEWYVHALDISRGPSQNRVPLNQPDNDDFFRKFYHLDVPQTTHMSCGQDPVVDESTSHDGTHTSFHVRWVSLTHSRVLCQVCRDSHRVLFLQCLEVSFGGDNFSQSSHWRGPNWGFLRLRLWES